MRIGRDHIASTVYTLAFAYAGSALPLIMVAALIDRSVWATILSGEIAEEVVRTLVSSIGLVLAIPATTLIAAFLSVRTADKAAIADGSSHRGSHRADNGGASARGADGAGAAGV